MTLEEMLDDEFGEIYYIGKTNKDELYERLNQHRVDKTFTVKTEWLKNNKHEIILIEDDLEDWEVVEREQYWITYFGTHLKLNRIRAKKVNVKDGIDAMKRAKQIIKDMKKANN